ncbi:MAG: tryptophan synthase subunit alpha [Gammaproteobacteria bacterium RIFCSPHIGHO2_12_FULL_35_23]|nr:MAG: tryptophan synthase subunit alpha [Gammaproteobacteria bacterium RIFCSPHIGHO2_12_FULL_35_23]
MDRIAQVFKQGSAYLGYLTAGHQGLETSLRAACALIAGGVNMLEIGVPFSDPTADGPVIQLAMQDALQRGTTLQHCLTLATELRQLYPHLPLILFSYYNPILKALPKTFLSHAKQAGFDATLIVDLPIEEALPLITLNKQAGLATIFVVTPDTTNTRFAIINQYAQGFIYYACRRGTTGVKNDLPEDFQTRISELKLTSRLPVVAGFGIASQIVAQQVLTYAEGFVVGSKFVTAIEQKLTAAELTNLARSLLPNY